MSDPRYADLDEVYQDEVSPRRLVTTAKPTPKAPTEPGDRDSDT